MNGGNNKGFLKMSGSRKARSTSARLFSVQAVYQALQTEKSPISLLNEYLDHNIGMDLEDGEMVTPDEVLFKSILSGVTNRSDELSIILTARLPSPEIDSLLKSILLCGVYEVIGHPDIDAPIIIADYLNVSHGFYAGSEPKLVNGILDAVAKEFRLPKS